MEIKIREICGEWALDIETPDRIQVIYFKSLQNALQVVHYFQLVDNIIKLDKKKLQTPITNYDRIKAMSVEEMADALFAFKECNKDCPMAKNQKYCFQICDNASVIKKWLESEVEIK